MAKQLTRPRKKTLITSSLVILKAVAATPDEENESKVDGMDERRTGLDVDSAIAEIIGKDPKSLVMQDHGDACSSETFKITAVVGERKYYFVKLGPNGEMFKGGR